MTQYNVRVNPPIAGSIIGALVFVFIALLLVWGIVWAFDGLMKVLMG